MWKLAPLWVSEIAIDFASQLALNAVEVSWGKSRPPSEIQCGLTTGQPDSPMIPGVSPIKPTSKEPDIRWISRDSWASRRKCAQAMLVRDEFWNTIEGSRVHLLYDREGMDWAGWDAQVAVCAATLINDRQQGLQGKGVYRAKGYARRTPETAVRIDEKGVP